MTLFTHTFVATTSSGADGRFEVTLQRPGAWRGAIRVGSRQPDFGTDDLRRLDVNIPDGDDFTLELAFDSLPRVTSLEDLWR